MQVAWLRNQNKTTRPVWLEPGFPQPLSELSNIMFLEEGTLVFTFPINMNLGVFFGMKLVRLSWQRQALDPWFSMIRTWHTGVPPGTSWAGPRFCLLCKIYSSSTENISVGVAQKKQEQEQYLQERGAEGWLDVMGVDNSMLINDKKHTTMSTQCPRLSSGIYGECGFLRAKSWK